MKNTSLFLALFLTLQMITSCGETKEGNAASSSPSSDTASKTESIKETVKKIELREDELASKKDPVCDMPVVKNIEDTTTYDGKIYAFCSSDCKAEFLKDPKQYLSKAGK